MSAGSPTPAGPTDCAMARTRVYRSINGHDLRAHYFLPGGRAERTGSAIAFFHGGGWIEGSVAQFFPQAQKLAELGMVAACFEYRIRNRHGTTPFDALCDAKAAIHWLRRHADEFGFRPDRLAAAGGSAGGHLAACTALVEGFQEEGAEETKPNLLILFNPVVDTTESGFGTERVTAERKLEISPCHHIKTGLPATLVMHGDADTLVPHENAERFTRQMQAAGNVCKLITYPGRQHSFFNRRMEGEMVEEKDYRSTLRDSIQFLKEQGYL